jgi:hypothetical protein
VGSRGQQQPCAASHRARLVVHDCERMATRSQFRLFIFFGCFVRTEYFESLADGRRPDNVLDRVPIKRATELDTTAAPTAERPVPMDVTVSTLVAIRNKVRIILCVCVCVCVCV